MKKILIINGTNLNFLGKREKSFYGSLTLKAINKLLRQRALELQVKLLFYQSNHEGDLIDFIQQKAKTADGILINPGALTHYGYSLRDALTDSRLPIVEVHLSNITKREPFRRNNVLDDIVVKRVMGLKEKSYLIGLDYLVSYLKKAK